MDLIFDMSANFLFFTTGTDSVLWLNIYLKERLTSFSLKKGKEKF